MHFEILIEDRSGQAALEILIPKIIDSENTYRVLSYKGIGHIPKNLNAKSDPSRRILLNRLPSILRGYGKTYTDPKNYRAIVILICDLDNKNLEDFTQELFQILNSCNPMPETYFCIAIEEGEAWLMGDISAIKLAYPKAKDSILNAYENDSICGTWERLADAIYKGGASALSSKGSHTVGIEKSLWAKQICPHMDVDRNKSPSFCAFRDKLRNLCKNK